MLPSCPVDERPDNLPEPAVRKVFVWGGHSWPSPERSSGASTEKPEESKQNQIHL